MANKSKAEATASLMNINGNVRLTIMGVLTVFVATLGFLLLLMSPAQAWTTKGTTCTTSNCHGGAATASPQAVLSVAVNGTSGTSVSVAAGATFEVDWMYTNMLYSASKYSGTAPEIAVPVGWTVAAGTANTPPLTGWSTTWNAADGVSWNISYSTAAEFPSSPDGYSINFDGTLWDNGSRNCAYDDGSSGDRDGVANKMGTDARITVPAGTAPGTYTVMVIGVGHNESNTKAHIEQAITVTVTDVTAPTVNTFTMPATASSLTVNVTAFTASDNVAVTGYKITESATAPLAGDAGWTGTAPGTFTFSGGGTKTAYAWAKDAAGNVSTSRSATVNITVLQNQTITFNPLPTKTYGDFDFAPGATASSGLTVSYASSNPAVATIVSGQIHIVGAGSSTITASQAGNGTYNPAPNVQQTLTVNKAAQATVTVSAPASAVYAQTGLTASASGGSGTGVYSYSHGASTACTVNSASGALTITSGTGTCSITATRATDTNYNISAASAAATVTISKATQATLSVTGPSSVTYGSTGSISTSGGSGTGTMSYSHGASTGCTVNTVSGLITVTDASGTCSVTATKATDNNYNQATSAGYTVTLNKATQSTVTVSAPASAVYGQSGLSATASGGSGTGAYSYNAGASTACSVNSASGALTITSGSGTCSITATRATDSNYNISAVSAAATVTISKANSSVTVWPTASAITYGQTLASPP